MNELTNAELKRREKGREWYRKFADWLHNHGLETDIVYLFDGEIDKHGIYDKWLEFMSNYCHKAKITNTNLPVREIGWNGGLGTTWFFEGFEKFINDCDETGKIYIVALIGANCSYKKPPVIFEVRPAALFARTCIGQKSWRLSQETHFDFYNEEEKTDVDLLWYACIWNKKIGKVLFADWDMGIRSWYFGL